MEKWEAAYVAGIIDGEGSITLTRMHGQEFRRPCISIASTDLELLLYRFNHQHLVILDPPCLNSSVSISRFLPWEVIIDQL